MESELDQLLINKAIEIPNRLIIPDVRCICGKVIPEKTRLAYSQEHEPGSLSSAKDFMRKYGINRSCCMNSLFNPTTFPIRKNDLIDIELSKSFLQLTDYDRKLNENLIEINNLYKKYVSLLSQKTLDLDKILLDFEDFFEDKLWIYEEMIGPIQDAFRERFYLAKENKDILRIINILKEYAENLAGRKGISKLDKRKIKISPEKYRREKILKISENFILRKNDTVEHAAEHLTEIYMMLFHDSYPSRDPTFTIMIKNEFSKEEIVESRKKFIDLLIRTGNYPLFSNVAENLYTLKNDDGEGELSSSPSFSSQKIIIQKEISQENLILKLLENRDYREEIKNKKWVIHNLHYDDILEIKSGLLFLSKTEKKREVELSEYHGGDRITKKILDFFSPGDYDKIRDSYMKKTRDIEIMENGEMSIIRQQRYFDIMPETKLGILVLDQIQYMITEFRHFGPLIKQIMENINNLQPYFYGLIDSSQKFIEKKKLKIDILAEDNIQFIRIFKKQNLPKEYREYMEKKIKDLESKNVYEIVGVEDDFSTFVDDYFYSGIVTKDKKLFLEYFKNDIMPERRIRALFDYKDRGLRMFDWKWVYDLWNQNEDSFLDFIDKLKIPVKQVIQIFDGYEFEKNNIYPSGLHPDTKFIFKNFSKLFEMPRPMFVDKYDEILNNYEYTEEDYDLEEAYTYLTDPNKKLPKPSGYIIGGDEGEGEQAEQAAAIEKDGMS